MAYKAPTKPGQRPIFFFVVIRRQHPFFSSKKGKKKRTQSGCLATVFLKIKIGGNIYTEKKQGAIGGDNKKMRDVYDLGKQRRSFFTAVNTLKRLNPEDRVM